MNQILTSTRVTMCIIFLIYASWSDYKNQEVSNSVWIFFTAELLGLKKFKCRIHAEVDPPKDLIMILPGD